MVTIKPFKAIRPSENLVERIATLPYDVLDSNEAYELGKDNQYSYLHIDKAEIDLPKEVDVHSQAVYDKAAENLHQFELYGWLQKEKQPYYYLYELEMNGRKQLGLVTVASVQDYVDGLIKKHEFTRPEKELDRINHSDALDANTSPIFLTYNGKEDITKLLEDWAKSHQPVYDFDSFHDVHHKVWVIDDEATNQIISDKFATEVEALYIADGHHRTESAVKVGLKRKEQYPGASLDAEFNFFLSVLFPKEELEILDYNRVLKTPLPDDFYAKMEEMFTIEKVLTKEEAKPKKNHEFAFYEDHQWYRLTAKPGILTDDPVEGLDVSILQNNVLYPLLDVADPRTSQNIDFIGGIRGLGELERLVDHGDFESAFALFPPTMDNLLSVADAKLVMPPKSTWFEPKLLSGLFLHDFESNSYL
jgi:uncharacterized protein (DUF1015 family)